MLRGWSENDGARRIKHACDTFCSHFIAFLLAWLSADPLSVISHCRI